MSAFRSLCIAVLAVSVFGCDQSSSTSSGKQASSPSAEERWGGPVYGLTSKEIFDTPFVQSCLRSEFEFYKQGYSDLPPEAAADQCTCRFLWAVINGKPTLTADDYGNGNFHFEKKFCYDAEVPRADAPGLVEGMRLRRGNGDVPQLAMPGGAGGAEQAQPETAPVQALSGDSPSMPQAEEGRNQVAVQDAPTESSFPTDTSARQEQHATEEVAHSAGAEGTATDVTVRSMSAPNYPPSAARAGAYGVVSLVIDVNASGIVTNVAIEKSSRNRDLDRAAMDAARRWEFNPAKTADGQTTAGRIRVPVTFGPSDAGNGSSVGTSEHLGP